MEGRRVRTTVRGAAGAKPATEDVDTKRDTVNEKLDEMVAVAGYDKPVTASKETVHIINRSTVDTITSIKLHIIYKDTRGRMLHNRDVTIGQEILPGETRLCSFPTWDQQRSFYYIQSVEPRRQATPYTVEIIPIWVTTCYQLQK